MLYLEPTFWLLISFLIFFIAIFKFAKNFINAKITSYKNQVSQSIEDISSKRHNSGNEVSKLKQEIKSVKEVCQKIVNSSISEAEQIESRGRSEIESYLKFKEKYTNERIEIFSTQKIRSIKSLVLNQSLILVNKYLEQNATNNKIHKEEVVKILKKI
jgi:F-type H+-transporting ATPase subunit b